jgi:hypothetical protein
MPVVQINLDGVSDWPSFHRALATALSFPAWYGANTNAFIDCLITITLGQDEAKVLAGDETVTLYLEGVHGFRTRCPDMLEALHDWVAFANAIDLDRYDRPAVARVLVAYHG